MYMKIHTIILSVLMILALFQNSHSQSFTFHGGVRPNNLLGSHFSVKVDLIKRDRSFLALNMSLVKYMDSFANPDIMQPNFHIENTRDVTFMDLPKLNRGYAIQKNEIDFRPRDLIHRFSIFYGYDFLPSTTFVARVYMGPHLSLSRSILYWTAKGFTPVIVNEGDSPMILPFHDFQIYRSWDIGLGSRVDIGYKILGNVDVGLSSQIFFDMIQEGIDLIIGGGITYHF